jgi:hypothetical protein
MVVQWVADSVYRSAEKTVFQTVELRAALTAATRAGK